MERYLGVNLLGPGPRLLKKKRFYRAAVLQSLRNTGLGGCGVVFHRERERERERESVVEQTSSKRPMMQPGTPPSVGTYTS